MAQSARWLHGDALHGLGLPPGYQHAWLSEELFDAAAHHHLSHVHACRPVLKWGLSTASFLFCLNCAGKPKQTLALPLVDANDNIGGSEMAL